MTTVKPTVTVTQTVRHKTNRIRFKASTKAAQTFQHRGAGQSEFIILE
jgi:hypothetical protein